MSITEACVKAQLLVVTAHCCLFIPCYISSSPAFQSPVPEYITRTRAQLFLCVCELVDVGGILGGAPSSLGFQCSQHTRKCEREHTRGIRTRREPILLLKQEVCSRNGALAASSDLRKSLAVSLLPTFDSRSRGLNKFASMTPRRSLCARPRTPAHDPLLLPLSR